MAINLKFDLMGNPEPPAIVLANRSGNKLGQLNVSVDSIDVKDSFNSASEFSFTLNKYTDNKLTPLWNKVVDFKLVYCSDWDMWFEIKVELDEATETVKTVYCTQLGQAELSQIMVYNLEINTEADIEREDYKTTILYDEKNPKSSILHRLLEKAPHYSIAYVDESIQRIQRQFSFNDTSICDAFNEIAEEIGCLFVYNSNSQAGGKPNRTISVYDLQQNCNNKDCKHRGEFTDKCPKCGNTDIKYGYGEDTLIFVTADELATEGIQLVTDTDSVKNCFKLEAGDDLMTATIRSCNPNGSDYIWYFSDSMKEDMSKELVDRIESYDELYKEYYNNRTSQLDEALVNQYNSLVAKYDDYYNTKSTCLDCKNKGDFEEQCSNPECNSKNILVGQKLQTMPTAIVGYPNLMTVYYNTVDLLLYLESGLMPNVEMSDTTAEEQVGLLTTLSLSPVAVNVKDINNASEATANSAVLSMAKVLIKPTYKVDIVDGSYSLSQVDANGKYKTWSGKFIVTNYSDDKDTATGDVVSVRINNATETFIEQKIDKALNKENTDDYSVAGLFAKDYDAFCEELHKYALNPLDSFSKICDTCMSILTEQGVGDEDANPDLYAKLYKPYFDKQQAINNEITTRQNEIAIIEGVWDMSDEDNPKCTSKGLQQCIEDCQKIIQDKLNFENHLGEDLWLEFCAYRREDKYSNSNYISDGLNNAELFKKANEFIGVAEEEIFKSAELQHSISATLNNLLSLPKFKLLLESFKTGNWIRVQADDKVYKLRLLEYDFGYGDIENISVEFSDVTKIKNGTTDVQDVFEQASSMASSYDSVQRQAKKGNVARSTIDQWIVDGLNSANVQIQSNDSEEIVLTQSGLLARSYDDITGTYSPEQLKITHNIMAYTDDNWETVSSALGKHKYKYWKDDNFVDAEGYGLTSKFVSAGYITGSQIVSGEIVSDNYEPNTKGTYFDLNKGDFEIAGGKIAYNATSDIVTLDGVTIVWDDGSTNAPTITQIDGLSDILDNLGNLSGDAEQSAKDYADEQDKKLSNSLTDAYQKYTESEIGEFDSYVAKYFGLSGNTIVNDNYLISPYISGGYLNITNTDNNSKVIIDPNNLTDNGYIFQIHNGKEVSVGIDHDGNASFSGRINATSLTLGDKVYISTSNITGLDAYAKKEDIPALSDDILYTDDISISSSTTADGLTTQSITVGDNTYTSIIGGNFVLTDIGLGTDSTDGSQKYTCISNDGLLTAKNAVIYGTVYATDGRFSGDIEADSLTLREDIKLGNDTDGYHTWINKDGTLNTIDANISGEIRASKGQIGGFTIEPTETAEDGGASGGWLYSSGKTLGSDKSIFLSATDMNGTMPFAEKIAKRDENGDVVIDDNGDTVFDTITHYYSKTDWRLTIGNNFGVTNDGTAYMSNCEITGGSLQIGSEDSGYYAWISSDGVLNASGANINGTINAVDGRIGGWDITKDGIGKKDGNDNPIVGIHSGNTLYASLVNENAKSPIRFCAGGQVVKTETLTFTSAGETLTQIITLSEEEQAAYEITDTKCLTTTQQHNGSASQSVSVLTGTTPFVSADGEDIYSGTIILSLLPAWVSSNHITTLTTQNEALSLEYIGNGEVRVRAYSEEPSVRITGLITIKYSFTETLDINVAHDNTTINVTFNPQTTDTKYKIDIEYILHPKESFSFIVLEDGSCYANNAKISGTIYATDGEFNGTVSAKNGNIGGLIIDTKGLSHNDFYLDASGLNIYGEGAELAVGNVQLYNDVNLNAVTLKTSDKFVIQGENDTAIAFMANDGESKRTMYIYITATTEKIAGVYQCTVIGSLKDSNANPIECLYSFDYSGKFILTSLMGTQQQLPFVLEFKAGTSVSNSNTLSYTGASFGFYNVNGNLVTIGTDNVTTIADLYVGTKNQTAANNFIDVTGHLTPTTNSENVNTGYDIGSANDRWRYIYARNGEFAGKINAQIGEFTDYLHTHLLYSDSGTVDNSDKNKKNTINILSNTYNAVFDKLRPVTYKYNDGTSNRLHTGFIAQEVRDAVTSSGLTTQDFAGYCEWIDSDGNETCGLRYSEFIALCVNEIQKLKKRVAELENK